MKKPVSCGLALAAIMITPGLLSAQTGVSATDAQKILSSLDQNTSSIALSTGFATPVAS